ncbi:GNAT family N-acetyltransferase [Sphingobacterium sp. UME9]|uniref:GNAT family N-acetyltransferase n=1 Tax=Sphingobacterium sp. UME9 TaxID=1862316 RepID=UPI0015FF434F|nr:GNAT family N-acetyltransferase [Sphingobacterium sp. UME9]MBB1646711.1 acetyltransferase [Sphingobacterium sp. UME9]
METEKLDNPAWYSLIETHHFFASNHSQNAKFYHPQYCTFGGFINQKKVDIEIDQYALLADSFYVVGEKPILSSKVELKNELVCNQMLLNQAPEVDMSEQIIELKTVGQKIDLFELVNLVQPGYFKANTPELGRYFGIYKNSKLIAVTGERMKMNNYTEISAVVTDPYHTGKGYAKQLIAHTSSKIFNENKVPYLHVAETNIGAIKLYEKLGFYTRRKISFWNLIKKGSI